jgi:hypothetical protein
MSPWKRNDNSMSPWRQKEIIDTAFKMVDGAGFRLAGSPWYREKICLYTKGDNEHGFANDIVLEVFNDWSEVIVFMGGWIKRGLAIKLHTVNKKK